MRIARRTLTSTLTILLAVALTAPLTANAAPAPAATTRAQRADWGTGFVSLGQRKNGSIPAFSPIGSTSDAVVAFVAARTGPINIKRALGFLRRSVEGGGVDDNVGLTAKVILAVVASGRDPHAFGGHDLITDITSTEQLDGRFGSFTAAFDQANAILALVSAGETPSAESLQWLIGAQCGDGGWQYDGPPTGDEDEHCLNTIDPFSDWFQADTNTTALVVQALQAADGPTPTHDPFDFFTAIRDADHDGWGYTWGFNSTDANSTAMVIQAYSSAGEPLPTGAMAALQALQYGRCGAFAYGWMSGDPDAERTGPDLGATIGAVPGMLRMELPIEEATVTEGPPAPIGCPL